MTRQPGDLRRVALLVLKLGTIAFGGPVAYIAMIEDEVVQRRGWISRERFLDLIGATAVIPGPNATEMVIHIGYARAGWPGLVAAGVCFILPAALISGALAWIYVRFGTLPALGGLLWGVKPIVIAVIIQAVVRLGRSAVKSATLAAVGVAAIAASAAGVGEITVLAAATAATGLLHGIGRSRDGASSLRRALLALPGGSAGAAGLAGAGGLALAAAPFTLGGLFLVFLKVGAILFGSGYVLVAFLEGDLVDRLGWLTSQQLLDAVAIGQVTPGPVFSTATFIGYLLGGVGGAVLATVGIFLPAFVYVAASGPLVPRIRESPLAGAMLDGVVIASLALMITVTVRLGRAALVDPLTVAMAAASALLLVRFRVNSAWLVAAGALIGLAASAAGLI